MNFFKIAQALGLAQLSADPSSPVNGLSYYNSTSNKLKSYVNGSWVDITTSADLATYVAGPASATDNAVARFDLTTGKIIQNSAVIIDDSNNITGVNDLTVTGNLTVNGTTTTLNTATLDVEDVNIEVNKGGSDATAEGAGLTIDRTGTSGSLVYEDALASKFKAGALGSEIQLANVSSSQTLTNKTIDADLNTLSNIENADIKAAAAIALNKLAATTANRALQSDGSGFVSASSVTNTELGYLSGVTSAIQTQLGGKANQALDNLAAVALNTSIISDTNNTDDMGSDALEFKDMFAHRFAHGDATNPNLTLETTSNNGSLKLNSHGTGNVDLDTEKFRRSKDGSSFIEEEYFNSTTLTASQTDAVIAAFTFAHASFEAFEMTYKIKEATTNRVRVGVFKVVTNGTDISYTDAYNDTADVGTAFSAAINGADVEIKYTTSANSKNLKADIKKFIV